MKFVVMGTGRCGTGYMSKILTDTSLRCGHEDIFTVQGPKYGADLDGDSSWLAVPYLDTLSDHIKVVHIVRNPLKVFRSWLFDQNNVISLEPSNINTPYNDYIRKHYPEIDKQSSQVDKACIYYIECNSAINAFKYCNEDKYFFHRVEDDPRDVIDWLKGNFVFDFEKYIGYNTRNKGIASDDDVVKELKKSRYWLLLKEYFIDYYPELEDKI
jgi:hypothetical protein